MGDRTAAGNGAAGRRMNGRHAWVSTPRWRMALVGLVFVGLSVISEAQSGRSAAIRRDIREILADPRYVAEIRRGKLLQSIGDWLLNVLKTIADALERLFRFGGVSDRGTARLLSYAIISLLAAAVAWAAVRAAALWFRSRRRLDRTAERRVRIADDVVAEDRSAEALLDEARAAAGRGDWLIAYRLGFESLLRRLHEAGILLYEAARTNGEHLEALRAHPELYALVQPVSVHFDALVYGQAPPTKELVAQCLAACQSPLLTREQTTSGVWRPRAAADAS